MEDRKHTHHIDICKTRDTEIDAIICRVHAALVEKGYDPISQLVGYIMSGDPTYITSMAVSVSYNSTSEASII